MNEDSQCCQLWRDCREEVIIDEMSDLFEVVIQGMLAELEELILGTSLTEHKR